MVLSVHSLTLDEAVNNALQNHPGLQVLQADIASAEGDRISAGALPNPDLSIGPGVKHTSDAGASQSRFHGNLEISQTLEFPGKRTLRVFLSEGNIRLRQIALEGFRQQLLIKVRRNYFQALAAKQIALLRTEEVQSAQTFLQSAHKRVEAGYASDFELLKAQSDLIIARKGLGQALGEARISKLRLAGLMGIPADTIFEVEGKLDSILFSSFKADPVALALVRNSSIKAQTLQMELAGKNIEAAKLSHKPDLTLSPSLEYTDNEQVYGLNFSVPLPVWNRGKGDVQAATAQQRSAQAELEKLKQEIILSVRTAMDKVRLAEEQRALYTPEFMEGSKSILTRAEKVYGRNETTLLIYLETRRAYFDALTDYYATLNQWADSHLELEAAMGMPPETHQNGEP